MYKDKDKQREAVKAATRRYRAKNADSALSGQKQGLENARGLPMVDEVGDTQPVIPSNVIPILPARIKRAVEKVKAMHTQPETQSYNPMMIGYVPPQE